MIESTTQIMYDYRCKIELCQDDGFVSILPFLNIDSDFLRTAFVELMWRLRGDTNIRYLLENGVYTGSELLFENWLEKTNQKWLLDHKWERDVDGVTSELWREKQALFERFIVTRDDFCAQWGELGRTYGYCFRRFGEVAFADLSVDMQRSVIENFDCSFPKVFAPGQDQLTNALELIRNNPKSLSNIISFWGPKDLCKTLLLPSHYFYHLSVDDIGRLHLNVSKRYINSDLDKFVVNMLMDVLFLIFVSHVTNKGLGDIYYSFSNPDVYVNYDNQIKVCLNSEPKSISKIRIKRGIADILDFKWEDIELL